MNSKYDDSPHKRALIFQNLRYRGSKGISQGNRQFGFVPAFYDSVSRIVYLSCYANGNPAPVHILAGLPQHLIRDRVLTEAMDNAKNTLIVGFVFDQQFFTRQQAKDVLAK